jgi:FlgD Ig-like domain
LSWLARVVFALLVAATFGAFFVSQRLKNAESVAEYTHLRRYFSPNGDGSRDRDRITFKVKQADRVTVTIVDRDGDRVRRLATGLEARPERPVTVVWDGKTDDGVRAPDGLYRMQLGLRRSGRSVTIAGSFNVDTTAPTPVVLSVTPPVAGPVPGAFEIRARGVGKRRAPRFRVLRTDVDPPQEVARFLGKQGSRRGVWDGQVKGVPAPPGTYMVVVRVRDRSGNVGTAPAVLPPAPGQVRGKPGITVRQLVASPPVEPVRAGERIAFGIDSRGRPFRWSVRRVGASRPIKKGRAGPRKTLILNAPRGISGAYLLQIQSGRYSARVPFLVQGQERAKLLVVVPSISWLGVDKVDDDGDGLPNTLESGGPVKWPRVLSAGGGTPPAFVADTAPLLVFLDRARIRYDLTSDIALAQSDDPRATDRDGVVLAGSLRWIPRTLARRLRRYVEEGGRLASFGTESMRRGVQLGQDELTAPTQPTPIDPFGARLEPVGAPRTEDDGRTPLPLTALAEDPTLGLLTGSDGTLNAFGRLEEAEKRPETARAKVLTSLGQDVSDSERTKAEAKGELPREALPVLTATRLDKGIEIRVGLTQWAQQAGKDAEVAQITRNIVDILRRVTPRVRSAG